MFRIDATSTAILETELHPAVYAEWIVDPKLPTLLIYGHHDVQPIDPLPEWKSPPFEPTLRDGRLYGRGVVDDKGQVYIHAKAIESFVKTRGKPPINLKMIVEGEEEIGSKHLDALLRDHEDKLRADYVVVSDTAIMPELRALSAVPVHSAAMTQPVRGGRAGCGVPVSPGTAGGGVVALRAGTN